MAYKRTPRPISEMVEESPSERYEVRPVKKNKALGRAIVIIVLIMVLSTVGFEVYQHGLFSFGPFGTSKTVASTDWTAVFLNNGQVYFGKVTDIDKDTMKLNDIYYLQVVTKPLQRTQEGATATPASADQQQLTLIKLGNELHGPVDEMMINKSQITLTEKLRSDSKVVQAINEWKKQATTPAK